MLATVDSKTRVLGVLSPDVGVGVSTLCRMIADSHCRAGRKTLLVDLTQIVSDVEDDDGWAPGDGAAQMIQRGDDSFDVLHAWPTIVTRPLFNNVDTLRRLFSEQLAAYEAVVVDLPPVLDQQESLINPLAAARACDAVIMICTPGRVTQQRIKQTVLTLGTAGIQLGGVVLNDVHNPTLGEELAASARKLARFAPRLASRVEYWLLANEFLKSRK